MTTFEIVYVIIGIVVIAVVTVLMLSFRKKDNGNDFEKFVKQTTNNLTAIDKVLSNFNDRLEKLENSMKKGSEEEKPKYIQTKYYAYEEDGKIIIEIYKNDDVKVILPEQKEKEGEPLLS
jgi:hypothetical protein